jgi:membrane protein implicated in regulation of membrane protease activity
MWQYWLIAAGLFFVAEIITVGFLVFWLGVAALIAMIVSLFIDNLIVQTVVFIISSVILILATKPFVNKFLGNQKKTPTNVFSLIDQKAVVIEDINNIEGKGQIKVNGEVWSAESNDMTNIEKGTEVKILEIKGVKTVVEPIFQK